MLFFHRPPDHVIRDYLDRRRDAPFTYSEVGASRDRERCPGFNADHCRVLLGRGEGAYARAVAAMRAWKMFPPEIVQVCWPTAPIQPGVLVAGLYRGPGVWALLPCRIVYTIDESAADSRRFGFGYGTVEGHWECGEEQFLVEQLPGGDVYYDLFALSRPAHPLARIGYPFTRREQARFRRLSSEAMQRATAMATEQP
jgi:uncharacterized protein (UPF0548 family)